MAAALIQANFVYDSQGPLVTHPAPLVVQDDIRALHALSLVNVVGRKSHVI